MKKMKFKCVLKSDIILSRTSSTEGNQDSLDFIPGNNFLGIVANILYKEEVKPEVALDIFHTGKVRFGDANPSIVGKCRGVKVPAAMFYPKLKKASEECFIHFLIDAPEADDIKNLQLKQCREGFYAFEHGQGEAVSVAKNYAIKSAYDTEKRRSKDGQMFGYESLPEGLTLFFEVESDLDDSINETIQQSLVGIRHIGRSKTAQYGLVEISDEDYREVESTSKTVTLADGNQYATVYADGRLIFLDSNDEPTMQPCAEDLGFEEGAQIDWSRSQIRSFQYAPWNGKRHTYDADRCGVEKGSVFVIKLNGTACPKTSQYVGVYRNEGFGKVIYNPEFLEGDMEKKGIARYTLQDSQARPSTLADTDQPSADLLAFLKKKKDTREAGEKTYETANEFVRKNYPFFREAQFASQWGSIRSLAMICNTAEELITAVKSFLDHGVAKAKWEERNRAERLISYMESNRSNNLQDLIINIASEMAKRCRKENSNGTR